MRGHTSDDASINVRGVRDGGGDGCCEAHDGGFGPLGCSYDAQPCRRNLETIEPARLHSEVLLQDTHLSLKHRVVVDKLFHAARQRALEAYCGGNPAVVNRRCQVVNPGPKDVRAIPLFHLLAVKIPLLTFEVIQHRNLVPARNGRHWPGRPPAYVRLDSCDIRLEPVHLHSEVPLQFGHFFLHVVYVRFIVDQLNHAARQRALEAQSGAPPPVVNRNCQEANPGPKDGEATGHPHIHLGIPSPLITCEVIHHLKHVPVFQVRYLPGLSFMTVLLLVEFQHHGFARVGSAKRAIGSPPPCAPLIHAILNLCQKMFCGEQITTPNRPF